MLLAPGDPIPAGTPNGAVIATVGTPRSATAQASTDLLTLAAHGLTAGTVIYSYYNGPAPLTADTSYYVRDVQPNTFKLATTATGPAINLTADGTLVFTSS